ncbi:MAG: hypothetical protein IKH40_02060 [Bacteroidales bacterium]|nr:hypothetical protein [Bacteroidales bacterium]
MKLLQKSIWLLAAVGLLAVSCAKEQSETPSAVMKDLPSITATTTAKVATKVTVGECEGQEKLVNWDTGDAISVFYHNVANLKFALEGEGGSPSGVFNYESGNGLGLEFPQVYGVFPYARATSMADGVIYTDFPVEQTFTEKSFDPQSNLMVAVSRTPDLFFQHVGGFLLLNLFGEDVEVTKAELRGNDGEILGGPAEVYAYEDDTPGIWFDPETGSQTLTLVSDKPVAVHEGRDNPTEFWLVVPPTLFEEGFTVTVTDAEGGILVAEVTSEVEIERNTIFRMAPLCLKRVASEFTAEIAWTYAEDAEMDHEVYYEGADPLYAHTAVPLGVDAATVAKYGEEIDGTVPTEVTVNVVDPKTGDILPADDVTLSNIALKDGELVADIEGFEWDQLYQITVLFELNTCDLTLEGTLATVDRDRTQIEIELPEYAFVLNGDDYDADADTYTSQKLDFQDLLFAAFQEKGIINQDPSAPDFEDADDFVGVDNNGKEGHLRVNTTEENSIYIVIADDNATAIATSSELKEIYESGEIQTMYLTTYTGQAVKLTWTITVDLPVYDFKHQYNYTFNDGAWYTMASPMYDRNKKMLQKYDYYPMNVPAQAFHIIDEKGRFFNWKDDDVAEDDPTYFYDKNLRINFFFTDPDLGNKELEQQCQTDGIRYYKDLWSQADPEEDNVNFEHAVFYYRTVDDAIPMYGTLQILSGDTYFDIPTSFEKDNGGKYLSGEDYSNYELRPWKPFYVLDYDRTVTITLDEHMIYAVDLFEGIQIYDGRQVAASSPLDGEVFEGDAGVYQIDDFNQGTVSHMRPMLGYNGAREPVWDWIYGNVTEDGTTVTEGDEPNGYFEGTTSGQAYDMKPPVFSIEGDIPADLSRLLTLQGNILKFDYNSQIEFRGSFTVKATIEIISPWYKFEPFTVDVTFQGYNAP